MRGLLHNPRPYPLTPPLSQWEREPTTAPQERGSQQRPITLLIAALGGEGGGVLTDWIVRAAEANDFPVQSRRSPASPSAPARPPTTSRCCPLAARTGSRRPVLALTPGIGDVDVMVASELMEAARAVASGFVTPDRTMTIASTSRFYVMDEKIAMGDGRYDSGG